MEKSLYPEILRFGLAKLHRGELGSNDLISLFIALENFQREVKEQTSVEDILSLTNFYISRLELFQVTGFYLVQDADLDFVLALCEPDDQRGALQEVVRSQIKSGKFAWILRQNSSVVVPAGNPQTGYPVVFHALRSVKNTVFPAHWDPKLRIPRGQVVAAASIVSPKY